MPKHELYKDQERPSSLTSYNSKLQTHLTFTMYLLLSFLVCLVGTSVVAQSTLCSGFGALSCCETAGVGCRLSRSSSHKMFVLERFFNVQSTVTGVLSSTPVLSVADTECARDGRSTKCCRDAKDKSGGTIKECRPPVGGP